MMMLTPVPRRVPFTCNPLNMYRPGAKVMSCHCHGNTGPAMSLMDSAVPGYGEMLPVGWVGTTPPVHEVI